MFCIFVISSNFLVFNYMFSIAKKLLHILASSLLLGSYSELSEKLYPGLSSLERPLNKKLMYLNWNLFLSYNSLVTSNPQFAKLIW